MVNFMVCMLTKFNNVIVDVTISHHFLVFNVFTSRATNRGILAFGQILILPTPSFPSFITFMPFLLTVIIKGSSSLVNYANIVRLKDFSWVEILIFVW